MGDPIYDTTNGYPAPAAWIDRIAGNADLPNGPAKDSLALQISNAATQLGYLDRGNGKRMTSCDPLLGALYRKNFAQNGVIKPPTVVVTILNSLFQPLVLQPYTAAEQTLNIHGASVPQLYYPTYSSKTHCIPAARPHPTKPQTFSLGLGMFAFTGNAANNCSGALQLSYNPKNAGPFLGIAYYSVGSSPAAAAVTADVGSSFSDLNNFYSKTLDADPQLTPGTASNSEVVISGMADPTAFTYNTTFVTVWVRPPERLYTVQADDTLESLAQAFYGDPGLSYWLFMANRDQVSDPTAIDPGWILTIPQLA